MDTSPYLLCQRAIPRRFCRDCGAKANGTGQGTGDRGRLGNTMGGDISNKLRILTLRRAKPGMYLGGDRDIFTVHGIITNGASVEQIYSDILVCGIGQKAANKYIVSLF